jgi:hypothetical protein
LPVSIPAQSVLCWLIFVDPFLVMRTHGSFNHPGPMKKPIAILLRQAALKAEADYDPTIGGPSGGHLGRAVPHGTIAV